MGKNTATIFIILFGTISAILFLDKPSKAQILPSRTIEVQGELIPPPWTIFSKLNEKDDDLAPVSLNVGSQDITFYEDRISRNSQGRTSTVQKKLQEPEKEIALKLLNKATGEVSIIKITKHGAALISPPGYDVQIVKRANGIRWNKWNTEYRVATPANLIVLKNKYPETTTKVTKIPGKDKKGRKITITKKQKVYEEFIYSPYSEALHTNEFVDKGQQDLKNIVNTAFDQLRTASIKSRFAPDKNIADIWTDSGNLKPQFIERLPLLEQSDTTEFFFEPIKTFERVEVILAANDGLAYSKTCSKKSACGLFQFTDVWHGNKPGTYTSIARAYPEAGLNPDFETGSKDQVNSAKAAILLYDYNIANLVKKYGQGILDDSLLEEYAGAAYNGSPKWVNKSLSASISNALDDWTGHLKSETKGYMLKLRYLHEHNLP